MTPAPFGVSIVLKESIDLRAEIARCERALIVEALERTQGNKCQAARLLGLNRTTFIEKMRKYGFALNPPSSASDAFDE